MASYFEDHDVEDEAPAQRKKQKDHDAELREFMSPVGSTRTADLEGDTTEGLLSWVPGLVRGEDIS